MKLSLRDPRGLLLDQLHVHSRFIFGLLSLLILLAGGVLTAFALTDRDEEKLLPIEFRLIDPHLSHRPVLIDDVRSCSCWHGPRDQAQRKYKFRIVNNTHHVLDIDGGVHSVIRLLVAYPRSWRPHLTMPNSSDHSGSMFTTSPPDVEVAISSRPEAVPANRIRGDNSFLGVPANYIVWALPAVPNKTVERIKDREVSYPTVVDNPDLLPEEEYQGDALGHGTWIFFVPLPHHFAQSLEFHGPAEPIITRKVYERHVIFIGVAALIPGPHGTGRLLGFAPAPSENALADPSEL